MNDIVQGEVPNATDEFYFELGREAARRNLQTLNDALGRLIVLASSLIGGGLVLLNNAGIGPRAKAWTLTLFTAALLAAIVGLVPYLSTVLMDCPDDVRQHREAAGKFKRKCLFLSLACLFFGFVVVVCNVW